MTDKRKVEIFSAGCPICAETIQAVRDLACSSCEVTELDVNDPDTAQRARDLGVQSVPAVVIDGKLADCCAGRGVDRTALRAAGIGEPL